jgi:hypothetical protein
MTLVDLSTNENRVFQQGADIEPAPTLVWPTDLLAASGRAQALFARDGYLHLSKLLPEAQLRNVARDVSELFASQRTPGSGGGLTLNNILRADRRPEPSGRREFSLQVEHAFRELASLRSLIQRPEIRRLLAWLGVEAPVLFDDQCYLKPERDGGPTYLHRDSDFFGPLEVTTVWISLTKADVDSACLWFLPGSHVKADREFGLVRRSAAPRGDLNVDRELDFFYEVEHPIAFVPAPCEVGDVILIHRKVLHASRPNSSARPRLSYLLEVVPEASVCLYRKSHPGVFEYHDRIDHFIRLAP